MRHLIHPLAGGSAACLAALGCLSSPTLAADGSDATLEAALTRALTEAGHEPVWQVGTPFEGVPSALQAPNRARGIRSWFLADGVRVVPFDEHGQQDFSLTTRLARVRRGESTRSFEPVAPTEEGDRVEYSHPELVEWYANGERGLEQGFDLAARPFPAAAGALELEVELGGGLVLDELEATRFFLCDATDARVLSFSGLRAWDADGRALPSRFEERAGGVAIVVDDDGARYPIVVDPTIENEEAKIVPTLPPGAGARSLAVSGERAVVGGGTGVYVLVRTGSGEWVVQAKLNSPEASNEFGFDVAIFGDWIVVGAPDDGPPLHQGAGYTYEFALDVGRWEARTKLSATGAFGELGRTVDVTAEFLAIGDPFFDGTANESGVVLIYMRSGSSWLVNQIVYPPSGVDNGAHFGASLDITPGRLAIGSPGNAGTGQVRVYEFDGDSNAYEFATLLDSGSTLDLGASVALAGPYLLAGSPTTNSQRGLAVLFERVGNGWFEALNLPGATDGERFGGRVRLRSLATGGVRALIAARWSDGAFDWTGRVGVYEGSSLGFTQVATLLPPSASASAGAFFGTCLGLGDDFALVGAVGRSEVHAFDNVGLSWPHVQVFDGRAHDPGDTFGSAVALAGDYALVGARLDGDVAAESGSAQVFLRVGDEWENLDTLRGNPVQLAANYGAAVALADDASRVLVGAPNQDGEGAAFMHIETFGDNWAVGDRLDPPGLAAGDLYGSAVDVTVDLALVGAPHADDSAFDGGAAHVFRRSSIGLWFYEDLLLDPQGAAFDDLGRALRLVAEDEILVGAPGADGVALNAGKVLRYQLAGNSWNLIETLAPSTLAAESGFGFALASEGELMVVGAPLGAIGRVYVYRRIGTAWQLEATLEGEAGLGRSVGVDGTRVAVGGIDRAWTYAELGGVWLPTELVPSTGPIQSFQETTPVAASAGAILVGADGDDGAGPLAGAAWLFRPDAPDTFVPFGFGDGSTIACPCDNHSAPGSGSGCRNSTGLGGLLTASGSSSIAADDMVLEAVNMRPNSPCVLFEGDVVSDGTTFGDGLRFVFGQTHRVDGTHFADPAGDSTWSELQGLGLWEACDTRYFQVFYRDAAPGGSPCGSVFNLSNGMQITFLP